jgi:hypothetical protein
VQGKQHMESFPKEGALCVNKLFGLVHTNGWGLSKTPSLNKVRYFVYFTNEFFLKIIHLHLKEKN